MRAVHVRCVRGSWQIRVISSRRRDALTPELDRVLDVGREAVLRWRNRLVAQAGLSGLTEEFTKAAIGEGEIAVGYAERIAQYCASADSAYFDVVPDRSWISRRSIMVALRERGISAFGSHSIKAIDALSILVASALAWMLLLVHTLVSARTTSDLRGGRWWLAVYGEWSNRTRHVLPAVCGNELPGVVLVLGRPRIGLFNLAMEWKRRLGCDGLPPLMRPWSLSSLLVGLPLAIKATIRSMGIAANAPFLPGMRERVGMLYRIHLGLASACWWSGLRKRPESVVYGHTGTADSTLLELAQHESGVRTIHVVHGVSSGLNFTGSSSAAIFSCAHDARWHERLGGYGRCFSLPAPVPRSSMGNTGLMLLTNYAHPMNLDYRVSGVCTERDVLRAVSAAVRSLRPEMTPLVWKPHPAFTNLPPVEQSDLLSSAHQLGFRPFPSGVDWLDAARNARWVVTTASTAALQLLEAGIVPVVLLPRWIDKDCALSRYPLAVRDLDQLTGALAILDSKIAVWDELLDQAWRDIGPGRFGTISDWTE